MLAVGINDRRNWFQVASGHPANRMVNTPRTMPAATRNLMAIRMDISRPGLIDRASDMAISDVAAISAAEPRSSGASEVVISSTVELIRSSNSGCCSSTRRAMPACVKLLASGRTSSHTATPAVRPPADKIMITRGQTVKVIIHRSMPIIISSDAIATARTAAEPRRAITSLARQIRWFSALVISPGTVSVRIAWVIFNSFAAACEGSLYYIGLSIRRTMQSSVPGIRSGQTGAFSRQPFSACQHQQSDQQPP